MSKVGDLSAKPSGTLTPDDLRELARRIDDRRESGMVIPGSRVALYAEALRALARERAGAARDAEES